jgi:hypothetical protein
MTRDLTCVPVPLDDPDARGKAACTSGLTRDQVCLIYGRGLPAEGRLAALHPLVEGPGV